MKVFVERVPCLGKNGDRATNYTTYFDYAIHLLDEGNLDLSDPVHEISGYDSFFSGIRDKLQVKKEALEFAQKLADKLGVKVGTLYEDTKVYEVTTRKLYMAGSPEEAKEFFQEDVAEGEIRILVEEAVSEV